MEVVLAESYGMCFGVRDAVDLALRSPRRTELTVLGELVHNPEVLRRLRDAGVRIAPSVDAPVDTPLVMVTAHGASDAAKARLRSQGLEVQDATCPLVRHAHRRLHRLVAEGYFPVVIGKREHVEVRGLTGDLKECAVVECEADLESLPHHPRYGVVSQTTQPIDYVLSLVALLRKSRPTAEVRFVDTVCHPTKERQDAARRLGTCCDVVVVVGGNSSNNTRQLVRTCEQLGSRAYQVESAADLRPEWLAGARSVGLTAGTSTPDDVIRSVHDALLRLAAEPLSRAA